MILRQWCAVRGKAYLLEQWHPTRNGKLTPDNVTNSSGKEVWWRCEKGHEWKTQVKTRANSSTGCPYCREEQMKQKHLADAETVGARAASMSAETAVLAESSTASTAEVDATVPSAILASEAVAATEEPQEVPSAPAAPNPSLSSEKTVSLDAPQEPDSEGTTEAGAVPAESAEPSDAPDSADTPVSPDACQTPPAAPAASGSPQKKARYLGSVRFFKNLILAAVVVLIAVPTVVSVRSGAQLAAMSEQMAMLQTQLTEVDTAFSVHQAEEAELAEQADQRESGWQEAETPSYQELYSELYAPEAARSSVNADKTVYLTFDDGPSARTPEILEILERYNVKATFFVIGHSDEQSFQRMRDIVAAGHTLGVHSYSHNYQQIYASVESYLDDFNLMYEQIVEATGVEPQIFRFPGGSINGYNGGTWREIIAEMVRRGFVYFDWNVSNDDSIQSAPVPAATLAKNCLAKVGSLNRAVILMHDSEVKKTTVQALPAIIEGYQQAGFTFAPLTAEVKPVIYGYPG